MQSATGLHSVTAAVRVLSTGRVHSECACTGRRSWDTKRGSVAEGRGGGTARGGHPGTHEPAAPPLVMSKARARDGGGPLHPWLPAGQDWGTHLAFLPLPALSTELFLAGSLGFQGGRQESCCPPRPQA